jgi:hypothetical protein
MWHSVRLRLVVALVAGLAVVGLPTFSAPVIRALPLPPPQEVIAAHADVVAGTVAIRTETVARDEAERPARWFGPLFALGACALALRSAGHRRRGVVLAGAMAPHSASLASSSPRAPPVGLS